MPADNRRARHLRPAALAALAAAVTLAGAVGLLPRWPGLLHFVALPPLGLVTDLATLLVYAPGWPSFLLGVAASLVVRSAVLAFLLGGLDRRRWAYALRFYALVWPFAFLAAAMLYGARAVLFYGLFWFGFLAALALLVLTAAAVWPASPRLRSGFAVAARHALRVGTVGAYLAGLALLGVVADLTAPVGPVVLVPVSAALTYAAAQSLYADPGFRLTRRVLAALPAAGITALIVVAELGPPGPPYAPPPETSRAGSIMLMSGVDSLSGSGAILEIDPHYMGWTCERTFYYSYAGPGDGQPRREAECEITHGAPYDREDTLRSRTELVPFLEAQTAEMLAPAVVAGHSQGVWLLWEAAAEDRLPNIETIVLVGAFPENAVSYPRWGVRASGRVGRTLLELVSVLPRPGGTTVFQPDSPLGREWLGHPDAIERTLARPLPDGIRALSVPSAFDLPVVEDTYRIDGAVDACPVPVIHPNLPYAAEFQKDIVRFVEGRPPPPCPVWRVAIGPLFRHFAAPPSPE